MRYGTGKALAVVLALSFAAAACGGSGGDEPAPTPTSAQASPGTPQAAPTSGQDAASVDATDLAEHLRDKTARMWEAYNSYDLDALKAFYEESYWKKEEEELRSNMRPFQSMGATITAEETSPPKEIAPGKWEIRHTGRFSGGSVKMVFVYEKFGEDWLLTHAENE